MPDDSHDGLAFEGSSFYMRWAPKGMLVFAAIILLSRWNHSVQFATALVATAFVHGRWLAWTFRVADDGISLRFPFGRRKFLPKDNLTVRLEFVGAMAMPGRHRRWGYPLLNGILFTPDGDEVLRTAFTCRGYEIIET